MSKRADERKALVSARVAHEQDWAAELFAAHYSRDQIARLSIREPEDGGLGYYLPISTIRGLIAGRALRVEGEIRESRQARIDRENDDLDMQYRAAAALTLPREEVDPDTGEVKIIPADPRTVIASLNTMRAIGERKAKLNGDDASQQVDITVEHVDPTDVALRELAREFGKK